MISIVLYGRNDSYGYNLHKRAALSLNCMAEVLTADNDEILFVDYNTPDDFPTFPEAICDTLTEKAKSLLRVIRIRPAIHDRLFAGRTHLKALESISRNAAVRRSNPANRWILSTNTDMIFVPRDGLSLSDQVAGLDEGFYCAPRFELPETLWENFNRFDPVGVIAETGEMGKAFHLNEIVYGGDAILYDGPGDFQLMRREDLFALHGFHEDMLLGWHVDSNISKRLVILHGKVADAAPYVYGYHCDHTRQTTPAHAPKSVENSSGMFVDSLLQADIPGQAESWGLSGEELEEVRLTDMVNVAYRKALSMAIPQPLVEPLKSRYRSESYDVETGSPEHVLPFLIDLFANAPRGTHVVWLGPLDRGFELFVSCWENLGFSTPVTVWESGASDVPTKADAFIINFGLPQAVEDDAADSLLDGFFAVIASEKHHLKAEGQPRRIIGVNAIHNRYESLMLRFVGCSRTPFSARLRHGYLFKDLAEEAGLGEAGAVVEDWTQGMLPGIAGEIKNGAIHSTSSAGYVFYGPYAYLSPGRYEIELTLSYASGHKKECELHIDIALGEKVGNPVKVERSAVKTTVRLPLSVAIRDVTRSVEIRLHSSGNACIALEQVLVRARPELEDWTQKMLPGRAGKTRNGVIRSRFTPGHVFYGPYTHMAPGDYEFEITLSRRWQRSSARSLHAYVVLGEKTGELVEVDFTGLKATVRLPLRVELQDAGQPVEVRLQSAGRGGIALERLVVKSL